VGLIAGFGRAPLLVAHGILKSGAVPAVVAFRGEGSRRLKGFGGPFCWCGITRIGEWIRRLQSWGVREAVMIGGVRKREIYSPFRVLRYIPDIRTARIWYRKLRKDKRDNACLLAVADELAENGIELVSSVKYCTEHLAEEGQMTRTAPGGSAAADVEFGWRVARSSAALDIGQSLAVKERDIVAVEAIEGTDAMIRRAGRLCRVGGWTMVKVARPNQDMRFDVPTVGPQTLRNLSDARCACLVLEAGRTLILDKPVTLDLADRLGISIIGRYARPEDMLELPR
jgi:hypothetical protein